MTDTKVFSFPENGNNNDLATLLALNGNRGGFGGTGWGGGILGFLLGLFFGNGGFGGWGNGGFGNNGGAGFLANQINNDNGRDLLMQAITNSGEASRSAITQLATTLNQDFNLVNSGVQAINSAICSLASQNGMSTLQIINALQSGNSDLRTELAKAVGSFQLSDCQQTNTLVNTGNSNTNAILSKLDAIEDSRKDREITALTAKIAQLESQNFTTGVVQQAVAPILGQLSAIGSEVDSIKRCQPPTITLPLNQYTAVPTLLANGAVDFISSYWANRLTSATTTPDTTTTT